MSEIRGIRRKAREAALAYLYQVELNAEPVTRNLQKFCQHFEVSEESKEFFSRVVEGVRDSEKEIDTAIEEVAEHWKLYRMESVDRAILRMGTFELMFCPETDYQVVIDEGIELSKTFGSENSPAFVNGILDKLSEKIRERKKIAS
jgi:N utilization substance protein B